MLQAIIVGETNDREQALAIARETHPDLVICSPPPNGVSTRLSWWLA